MRLGVGLYTPAGALVFDCTGRAENVQFSTGEHGCEALSFNFRLPYLEARSFSERKTVYHAKVFAAGETIWGGRVDQMALVDGGLKITALGHFNALGDVPYLALWSDTEIKNWQELNEVAVSSNNSIDAYEAKFNEEIYVAPRIGEALTSSTRHYVGWHIPNGSARFVSTITFTYEFLAPNATWLWRLRANTGAASFNSAWSGGSITTHSLAGSGVLQTGTVTITPAASTQGLFFELLYNSAVATTLTGTTGASCYYKVTNVRIKTTSAVTVTAQEIAQDILASLVAVNANELSSSTALIGNPNVDIRQLVAEDADMRAVLDDVAKLGDGSGNLWTTLVWADKRLVLEQRGSTGRTYYTDVEDVEITKAINDGLFNSVYTTYQTAGGDGVRTTTGSNTPSINDYGLTRRKALKSQTDNVTEANNARDVFLARHQVAVPKASIEVKRIYDKNGRWVPLYLVRAYDTVVVRNLLATSQSTDKLRVFTLAGTSYDADDDKLTITPESPVDGLQSML